MEWLRQTLTQETKHPRNAFRRFALGTLIYICIYICISICSAIVSTNLKTIMTMMITFIHIMFGMTMWCRNESVLWSLFWTRSLRDLVFWAIHQEILATIFCWWQMQALLCKPLFHQMEPLCDGNSITFAFNSSKLIFS